MQHIAFHLPNAVLGANRTAVLLRPLVHKWLDDGLNIGVKAFGRRDVHVDIPVAQMPKAVGEHVVAPSIREARAHILHEVVHPRDREADVVFVRVALRRHGWRDALAAFPNLRHILPRLRDGAVDHATLTHDGLQKAIKLLLVVVAVGAMRLHDHIKLMVGINRERLACHFDERLHGARVHELASTKDLRAMLLCHHEGFLHIREAWARKERHGNGERFDGYLQTKLRNNAQSAL
mmetsp:Transcript_65797/g.109722  ORF Transcript_65797/g.109722 Transcript_65797/m.109722 type:complete len:235 (-) Transcript_65797:40-744(-)